ncbi:MAG: DUF167 domain-containing protein [Treponema sp.]|jgi:uncharacterized protein (TIGR00251 family)|nr:DUF167 domain-containing protein [Treponema sp.]
MEGVSRISGGSLILAVKAVPGASKTEAAGIKDGRLRIRIAAAPEGGKANSALAAFLARTLGCAKKDIVIVAGEKSRLKTVSVPSACEEKVKAAWGVKSDEPR